MADNIKFENNASGLLSASITDVETLIALEPGYGALFPTLTGSQYFLAALQNADGDLEIVRVTARTVDNLTVTRGQEGTVAQAWTLGVTRLELRATAGTMEEFVQKNGGTMTGTLDMNEQTIQDAVIDGDDTVFQGGQIVGVPLRGALDDDSNEVAVPDDGSRATASGAAIMTQADLASNGGLNLLPVGTVLMWYGVLASLPTGWQNCDGTNGSPDLRDRFPIGAGGALALGANGGSATASGVTGAGGAHTHTGAGDAHTLTVDEMPAHRHRLWGDSATSQTDTEGLGGGNTESVAGRTANESNSFIDGTGEDDDPLVETVGGGAAHSHNVTVDAAADHTHTLSSIATVPPYRALYFVMRVS